MGIIQEGRVAWIIFAFSLLPAHRQKKLKSTQMVVIRQRRVGRIVLAFSLDTDAHALSLSLEWYSVCWQTTKVFLTITFLLNPKVFSPTLFRITLAKFWIILVFPRFCKEQSVWICNCSLSGASVRKSPTPPNVKPWFSCTQSCHHKLPQQNNRSYKELFSACRSSTATAHNSRKRPCPENQLWPHLWRNEWRR